MPPAGFHRLPPAAGQGNSEPSTGPAGHWAVASTAAVDDSPAAEQGSWAVKALIEGEQTAWEKSAQAAWVNHRPRRISLSG